MCFSTPHCTTTNHVLVYETVFIMFLKLSIFACLPEMGDFRMAIMSHCVASIIVSLFSIPPTNMLHGLLVLGVKAQIHFNICCTHRTEYSLSTGDS